MNLFFVPGDLVRLKSDATKMTVEFFNSSSGVATCVWRSADEKLQRADFSVHVLVIWEQERDSFW